VAVRLPCQISAMPWCSIRDDRVGRWGSVALNRLGKALADQMPDRAIRGGPAPPECNGVRERGTRGNEAARVKSDDDSVSGRLLHRIAEPAKSVCGPPRRDLAAGRQLSPARWANIGSTDPSGRAYHPMP
jgi:hypothetical protein